MKRSCKRRKWLWEMAAEALCLNRFVSDWMWKATDHWWRRGVTSPSWFIDGLPQNLRICESTFNINHVLWLIISFLSFQYCRLAWNPRLRPIVLWHRYSSAKHEPWHPLSAVVLSHVSHDILIICKKIPNATRTIICLLHEDSASLQLHFAAFLFIWFA